MGPMRTLTAPDFSLLGGEPTSTGYPCLRQFGAALAMTTAWVAYKEQKWKSDIRCQHGQVLERVFFQVVDPPSCLALTWRTEGWRVLWGLFGRALIPLAGAPPS